LPSDDGIANIKRSVPKKYKIKGKENAVEVAEPSYGRNTAIELPPQPANELHSS
jgi:hypothetical protein